MKHELLAPAGNIEAGYAALHYGADAVYLGLTKFSARAGAENFTADELDEFTAYAHSLKRKVFVALNTLLTEAETDELAETFAAIRRARVDALIIQDLGVFYLAKRLLPEVELHASTQMAVHNAEGAKFLQSIGFKRVVLARELSLAEIKAIANACPSLDLEVFVHGALCYSYSGQCLFSALEYGKSANRGRCVYPCRSLFEKRVICPTDSQMDASRRSGHVPLCTLPSLGGHLRSFEQIPHFSSTTNEESVGRSRDDSVKEGRSRDDSVKEAECVRAHLFSMKDLALEEAVLSIPALSLKIEGRKKSPLYVAAVTNYYRHILDGRKKDLNEAEDIKQIFSRPWCRFHFSGKTKDVTDENFVGHRGLLIGKVERVAKGRLFFKTTHKIARYDGIQIDSGHDEKPFGFGVKALFVNHKPVFEAQAEQVVELELPEERPHLTVGAPVYLASSSAVKGKYDYAKPKPGAFRNLTPLEVVVEIGQDAVWGFGTIQNLCAAGDPLTACGTSRGMTSDSQTVSVSVAGTFDKAKDVAKVESAVQQAFAKTGGTAFVVSSLEVRNPEGVFVPVSVLNELRRSLLEKCVICPTLSQMDSLLSPSPYTLPLQGGGRASGTGNEGGDTLAFQRGGSAGAPVCGLPRGYATDVAPLAMTHEKVAGKPQELGVVEVALDMDLSAVDTVDVWFQLPQICRNMAKLSAVVAELYKRGARHFIAENYYAFELLKPYKDVQIGVGSFLYVMNSYATLALAEFGVSFATLALESSPENMRAVIERSALPLAQVVKAYPPLFTSAVCIRPNACKDCKRGVKTYLLKQAGKEYTAISKDCQIQLFANVPYVREVIDGVSFVIRKACNLPN